MADRERGDGDRQGHGERRDDGERQRERLDEDDRRDRSEPRGDKSTMKKGPDASRDREHTQQQAERRERHAVPVGEEEIEEWEEAPRSKPEENFDDQKPAHEPIALRRLERAPLDRDRVDREHRDDRRGGDDPTARDEGPEHDRVAGTGSEERRNGRRERAGDRAREERCGRAERDLLTEPGRAARRLGRVGEERGARGARDDAAEPDERRGHEERDERVEDEDADDARAGQRPAHEDRGAS